MKSMFLAFGIVAAQAAEEHSRIHPWDWITAQYDSSYARRRSGGVDQGPYSGSSSHAKNPRADWTARANKYNGAKSWYDGRRYYDRRR